MAASIKIPTVFTAKEGFTPVVSKMTRGIAKFSAVGVAGMKRFDHQVNKTFAKIKRSVGSLGVAFGAIALFSVLSSGIGVIADYEQANANLAAILRLEVSQTKELQKSSKLLGATTKFTASQVAGLQTEYAKLGFSEKEILKVTKSTLDLAAATNTELPQAAKQVGATLRQFGLESGKAAMVSDVFALATAKSALNMEFLDSAMRSVAPVANKFGFNVKDVTSLLGNLSDSGFDASTAGTATRNILLNLADANGKLARSLGAPVKDLPSLIKGLEKLKNEGIDIAGALELTDKRSVAAFATFLDGTKNITKLSTALEKAGGAAKIMADKQLNTLTGRFTILKSAYEGFILSLDDGTGSFSKQAKTILEVATEMLSLMTGTALLSGALDANQKRIRGYSETALNLLGVIKFLIKAYIAFKIILWASQAALFAYNVALGVMGALSGTASIAIGLNSVALGAYQIASWSATASAWAFATGVNAGLWPILLIVAAVAAVILVFENWGTIIDWLGKKWGQFTDWFKQFSFVDFFKSAGQALIDFMLRPLNITFDLIHK